MTIYGKLSRYDSGLSEVIHKGKKVSTSVGSAMDDIILNMDKSFSFEKGKIPIFHAHRPDLISDLFYDTPRYWWFILQFNGVNDPFEFLNSGDEILIPTL